MEETTKYINEMSDVLADAIETILTTQDSAEEMDELLTERKIEHVGAPDSCRLIHLTAELARLRTFLNTDVMTAFEAQRSLWEQKHGR